MTANSLILTYNTQATSVKVSSLRCSGIHISMGSEIKANGLSRGFLWEGDLSRNK